VAENIFKSTGVRKVASLALLLAAFAGHLIILSAALQDESSPLFFDSDVIAKKGCDFYALYVAGDNLRRGRSVYEQGPDTVETPCIFGFRYLPTAAIIGAPLSILPPKLAYLAWVGVIELCLCACLLIVWFLADRKLAVFAPLACLWLLYTPMYLELRLGQFNLIQAFFVLMAAASLRRLSGHGFATWMAASLCWKHNTILAAPSLIKERKWWPLIIAAVLIALTSIPHFVAFQGSFHEFLANLRLEGVGAEHGFTRGNLGLAMLVGIVAGEAFAPFMVGFVFFSVVGIGLVLTLRKKGPDLAMQLCLWLALALLAYKHTWEHHFIMALPLLTLLGLSRRGVLFWIAAAFCALPTPYYFFRGDWIFSEQIIYHGWKIAGLALAIALGAIHSQSLEDRNQKVEENSQKTELKKRMMSSLHAGNSATPEKSD